MGARTHEGAAVRTCTEFTVEAGKDVSIATTYLESRLLLGSARLYYDAKDDFFAALDARAFFRDKMLELKRRHQKFDDTPYALEPNLKGISGRPSRSAGLSLGALRAAGLADSVEAMHRADLITEREMHTIRQCYEFLKTIRIELHLLAKRDEDRLSLMFRRN